MKFVYLFVCLLIPQIVWSQTNEKLRLLYEVLNKVEQGDNLKKKEIVLLLESYKDSDLRNNTEFSEWRSEALFDIINHPSNLQKMLSVCKDKECLFLYVLEELSSPVYEIDYCQCIKKIEKVKGNNNIKERMVSALQKE